MSEDNADGTANADLRHPLCHPGQPRSCNTVPAVPAATRGRRESLLHTYLKTHGELASYYKLTIIMYKYSIKKITLGSENPFSGGLNWKPETGRINIFYFFKKCEKNF